jgi:copper(I)-binding protein
MSIRYYSSLIIGTFFFISICVAYADKDKIEVKNAWVRSIPSQAVVTALYMDLHNKGEAIELLSVESDFFSEIQFHQMKKEDGMMSMQQLSTINLPSKQMTKLIPGGTHIMLFSPKDALSVDQKISFELVFSDETSQFIEASVKKQ